MNNTDLKTLKKSKSFINEEVELLQELVLKHQEVLLKKKVIRLQLLLSKKYGEKLKWNLTLKCCILM